MVEADMSDRIEVKTARLKPPRSAGASLARCSPYAIQTARADADPDAP
jgi:hypothetical protein